MTHVFLAQTDAANSPQNLGAVHPLAPQQNLEPHLRDPIHLLFSYAYYGSKTSAIMSRYSVTAGFRSSRRFLLQKDWVVVCIGCSRREPGGAGCPAKAEARRTIMSMDDDDVSRLFGDFFDSCNSPCPDVKAPPAVADGRAAVLVSAPAQQRPSPPGGRPKLKLKCKVSVLGSSALFAGSLFLRLRNERMRDPFLERKPGDGPFLTTIPRFVALIS